MELEQSVRYALSMYFGYLGTGLVLMMLFAAAYIKLTPFDEIKLIRKGNIAPTLSFGGALIGFSLTLASSAIHTNQLILFALWGLLAGLVQIFAFYCVAAFVKGVLHAMDNNNVAVGALLGGISIAVGILNAGCLS